MGLAGGQGEERRDMQCDIWWCCKLSTVSRQSTTHYYLTHRLMAAHYASQDTSLTARHKLASHHSCGRRRKEDKRKETRRTLTAARQHACSTTPFWKPSLSINCQPCMNNTAVTRWCELRKGKGREKKSTRRDLRKGMARASNKSLNLQFQFQF
jgi:hypothetical protein